MAFLAGCASTSVPTQQSASLPVVTSLKTISDMTQIGFEWLSVNDEKVIGYELYRLDTKSQKFKSIAVINDRFATHYVDTDLKPETTYTYQLRTFSESAISNPGESVNATTKPLLNSVPFAQAIAGLPNRVKLIWRPHPDTSVVSYVIKRANANDEKFSHVATIDGRLNAEFIDTDVKPGKNYKYIIYVKTGSGVLSNPSEVIQATTKKLPNPVTKINATQNEPKKIVLTWQAPQIDDFSHYNVYRAISKFLPYTYVAKTSDTSFEDLINSNGTTRYYKVTAVDIDGLESLKQNEPVLGATLAQPDAPQISANFDGSGINVSWERVNRASYYSIFRSGGGDDKSFSNITETSFYDSDITQNSTYKYRVVAVDEFGLSSDKSNSIEIAVK